MTALDQLLVSQAVGGVEYRSIGEVATYVRGVTYSKSDEELGGPIRILRANNITLSSNTINFVNVKEVSGSVKVRDDQRLRAGDILMSVASGSRAHVGKVAYVDQNLDFYFGGFMSVLRAGAEIDARFLFHILASTSFSHYLEGALNSTTINNLNATTLGAFRIPVPPIPVQQEIVRILDHFLRLEHELESERVLRTRQQVALARVLPTSVFVRSFDPHGLQRVRIGAIATRSSEPVRVEPDKQYVNLGVKWYGEGVFSREAKSGSEIKGSTLFRVKAGQFIYNRMFVAEGSFGVVPPELGGGVVSSEFPRFDLDPERVLPEWLLLHLLDEFTLKRITAELTGVERGSMKSRRRWKEDQFEAFEIDLPSLKAQDEIMRVLGLGVALEGAIEAEIACRRQQLTAYRDRLLSFEEAVA